MTEPRRTSRPGSTPAGATTGSVRGPSKDGRLAELESRLARLERAPSLRARGRSVMDKVMPPEASEHFRNAGREHLLGVRSIVDHWITRLDEADSRAAGRSRERETIEIE
jgi:hypothetical protein